MRYTLKTNSAAKVGYSPQERRAFSFLRGDLRRSTKAITLLVYGPKGGPTNALTVINGTLRSLQRKVIRNRERFRIKRTKRCGPYPVEYWVE